MSSPAPSRRREGRPRGARARSPFRRPGPDPPSAHASLGGRGPDRGLVRATRVPRRLDPRRDHRRGGLPTLSRPARRRPHADPRLGRDGPGAGFGRGRRRLGGRTRSRRERAEDRRPRARFGARGRLRGTLAALYLDAGMDVARAWVLRDARASHHAGRDQRAREPEVRAAGARSGARRDTRLPHLRPRGAAARPQLHRPRRGRGGGRGRGTRPLEAGGRGRGGRGGPRSSRG